MKKFIFSLVLSFLLMGSSLNSGQTSKIWKAPDYIDDGNRIVPTVLPPQQLYFLDPKQTECLALNIYFEAAIESTAGKLAVAQVTLNRVKSNRYPNTVCEVVYEGPKHANGFPKRDQCQFSRYCDGKYDVPNIGKGWMESRQVAEYALSHTNLLDITDGATHYHADYINAPRWARSNEKTVKIDTHIFYNKQNNFNF